MQACLRAKEAHRYLLWLQVQGHMHSRPQPGWMQTLCNMRWSISGEMWRVPAELRVLLARLVSVWVRGAANRSRAHQVPGGKEGAVVSLGSRRCGHTQSER